MERTVSEEERLRRAEEIYQRRKMANRNGIRVSSSSVNTSKTKLSLFKKMAFQLAICSVIYIIFYLIKNTNYIFSQDVIQKTKELLSYDINFGNVYQQVSTFFEENKDKFKMIGIKNQIENETGEQEENNNESQNEMAQNKVAGENQNTEAQTNETNANEINTNKTVNEGGIGGAETEEEPKDKTDDKTKKTQMELDAEYIKSKCSFKIPLKGSVTSRYGEREATEIVSAHHYGIDIGANTGTAIYAAMEGTVTLTSSEGEYRKTYRNYKWRHYDKICTL